MHTQFEAHAARLASEEAVRCDGESLSFGALNARANQLARYLQRLGVDREVLVAVAFDPSIEAVVALLAVLKAGGACVPLDPTAPFERLSQVIDDARPLLGLARNPSSVRLPRMRLPMAYLDEIAAELAEQDSSNLDVRCSPDALAFVIYGTGPAARAAGVMTTHRMGTTDRLLAPLLHGQPLSIARDRAIPAASLMPEVSARDRHELYAVPEAAGVISLSGPASAGGEAVSSLYLLDSTLRPAAIDTDAEIYLGGDRLARGYFGRPSLTAATFIADPFGNGTRLCRTGDAARRTADGAIQLVGAAEETASLQGQTIALVPIESALQAHPKVRDAAVSVQTIAAAGGATAPALVAYIVAEGIAPTVSDLKQHLGTRLPGSIQPELFVMLNRLPRTAQGRLDRRALPAPQPVLPAAGHEYTAPRNAMETALTEIWAEFLLLDRIGVHDDFLDIGGDSLIATQIVARVFERFGTEIPIEALFEQGKISTIVENFFTGTPEGV